MSSLYHSENGVEVLKWANRIRDWADYVVQETSDLHNYEPGDLLPVSFGACIGAHWGGRRGAMVGGLYAFHLRETVGPAMVMGTNSLAHRS